MLGADHGVTMAFAKAAESMAPADLWLARIAIKTLRKDQRRAIAEAAENEDQSSLRGVVSGLASSQSRGTGAGASGSIREIKALSGTGGAFVSYLAAPQ